MAKFSFTVRGGKVTGKDHLRAGRNCQDGYAYKEITIGGKQFLIGVISDGCSEGKYSEIAGLLLPVFIVDEIIRLLQLEIPIVQAPVVLYPEVIRFLDGISELIPLQEISGLVDFVRNYLLATVVGFILGEEEGVVFYGGDGYLVINEEIRKIDYQNRSPYLGYHLVPRSVLETTNPLPKAFETIILESSSIHRLAITTDGFSENLISRLWREVKPVSLGIQLWMNMINGSRNPDYQSGLFYDDATIIEAKRSDDATIIVAERTRENENA